MTRSEPFPQSVFPEDEAAVLALARAVRETGYSFTTVTPATHAHVNARPPNAEAKSLRDVFGWSRPFRAGLLPEPILHLMRKAGAVVEDGPLLRPKLRFSSLDGELFTHSAYPPSAADAVFFGPDTMRFANAVIAHLEGRTSPVRRAVDLGCGSGAAGICIAKRAPGAEVVLVDINPAAMRAARVNARLAGTDGVAVRRSDMLRDVEGLFDLIVSNPPFMIDTAARAYRHGGGPLGAGLSLAVAEQAVERLAPGGSLVLFTGAAIVEGEDPFRDAVADLCARTGLDWTYREFDPDEYGEELATEAYDAVERLALVVLTATRPGMRP
ncbi:Methyltransferase small domain-containing protein [Methylobacterium phyllostachyos]|uniref:Methyltransferase small domain-containing protein n=1 Tax=Methylobacterium phyllostachyos TaxID=582672 RepID=A0A1H0CAM8_9HYPH|nr:class I SAM-dependent methyltransferase [Methylobacterium phyllostachyos]SDN54938.1 Methyltransferase small domain-containing protein [Methylobacterium phyllostachyos]